MVWVVPVLLAIPTFLGRDTRIGRIGDSGGLRGRASGGWDTRAGGIARYCGLRMSGAEDVKVTDELVQLDGEKGV